MIFTLWTFMIITFFLFHFKDCIDVTVWYWIPTNQMCKDICVSTCQCVTKYKPTKDRSVDLGRSTDGCFIDG
mgnify:CR=1 FL=1